MSELKTIKSSIKWNILSILLISTLQIIFTSYFARKLTTHDYGIITISVIFVKFFSYFSQHGIGTAIVQKKSITKEDLESCLWISLKSSAIYMLLAAIVAMPFAKYYDNYDLVYPTLLLSISLLTGSLSSIGNGLLKRDYRFKEISIVEIIAYVTGYGIIGITLVYCGYSYMAIIAANLFQSILSMACYAILAKHPLKPKYTKESVAYFNDFGKKYSLVGTIEFISFNFDSILIGKLLGESSAGIYNRFLLLANLPIQQPLSAVSKSIFPLLSKNSSDIKKLTSSLNLNIFVIGFYAFPVSALVSLNSESIVNIILGAKWIEHHATLSILSLSVGPLFVSHIYGITFDALGLIKEKLKIQFAFLILILTSIGIGSYYGLSGVASAILFTELGRMAVYTKYYNKSTSQQSNEVSKIIFYICISCGIPYICIYICSIYVYPENILSRLIICCFVYILIAYCTMLLLGRKIKQLETYRIASTKFPIITKII